jgi:hypothetical protein
MDRGSAGNNRPSYDDRKGLGYGQLDPTYHVPKMAHDEFPYITPDTHEAEEEVIDPDDIDAFVQKVNMGYHITDFMSDKKNDPHYFVAGNDILTAGVMKNNLVPMPDLYKNMGGVLGGTSGPAQSIAAIQSRTSAQVHPGDTAGWAGAPPIVDMGVAEDPVYHLEDILSQEEEDAKNVIDLRKLISAIYQEQELATGLT